MSEKKGKKLSKYWKIVLILAIITLIINILARIRPVCDFYVNNIFRIITTPYMWFTGLFKFSLGSVFLLLGLIIIIVAIILAILLIFLKNSKFKKFSVIYFKSMLVIILITGLLMSLNCSALYRCSRIDNNEEYTLQDLKDVYNILIEKCNECAVKIDRYGNGEVYYDKDMDELIHKAVKKMSETNRRYRGYTPDAKPFLFKKTWYQANLLGQYFPFSMEANYSDYMNDITKAPTICHELSHLKGYIYEDEANYIAFLTCVESGDEFLEYAGYVFALSYIEVEYLSIVKKPAPDDKKLNPLTREYDFITYKMSKKDELKKLDESAGKKVVNAVSNKIEETYMNYYDSTPNYDEVTRLILQYYKGSK